MVLILQLCSFIDLNSIDGWFDSFQILSAFMTMLKRNILPLVYDWQIRVVRYVENSKTNS